ncbi:MAG TPA: hypothetical protein VNN80_29175 [Polyangiaceae bacterium]|nr:hypothetical protein [Polyangiaceae bacterium]
MSHGSDNHHEDKITIDGEASSTSQRALVLGVLALVGAVALGFGDLAKLQRAYLTAFMYVLSVALGALWFVAIQHLTNAKWSVVVRRVAEILANNMVLVGVLSLGVVGPMLAGSSDLYPWVDHARVEGDHILHHKAAYLNMSFFTVRWLIYFGFWIWLGRRFFTMSVRQDKDGGDEISSALQRMSAPAMIAFALTLTFCAIDLVMSLDPTWFSTMFGVYYFAGCVLAGYSSLALALMWVQNNGRLTATVNQEHYHDIGKMMFAFTIFWAYIGFSQFMLIWYADIPEETHWYHWRFEGGWKAVSALLLGAHFVAPFFGLMSRHVKRNKRGLAFWAVWILAIHYLDLFWLIYPNGDGAVPLGLVDILCVVGLMSLFVGVSARRARGVNLIPTGDPRLADSLAFENI